MRMRKDVTLMKKVAGVTLVELLVAMGLASFMAVGVVQMYLGTRMTHRMNDSVAEIQDNSRFAMDTLTTDIRMAGFQGCRTRSGNDVDNRLNSSSDVRYSFESDPMDGYAMGESVPSELREALNDDPVPMSDTEVMVVRGATPHSMPITDDKVDSYFSTDLDELTKEEEICTDGSDAYNGICTGDLLMALDCRNSSSVVFQVSELRENGSKLEIVHGSGGTPGNAAPYTWGAGAYGAGSELVKMNTSIYYLSDDHDDETPALYRKTNNEAAEPVAENVRLTRLRYGVDTDDDDQIDQYREGSAGVSWDQVKSVRLDMIVGSGSDNVVDSAMTIDFDGDAFDAPDRRLYRVVSATTHLRNESP